MKLWQNDYILNKKIEEFTVDDDYLLDKKLVKYDCIASIAHAKMLLKIGILTEKEFNKIIKELKKIIKLDSKNKFKINQHDEDCHTAIENYLIKNLRDIGKKIHTGRSRNDQVLTALRLYYKDEIISINDLIHEFLNVLESFKNKYGSIEFPGYTHMRKAMPSSISLWIDAFIDSMNDNKKLLSDINKLVDQSPLGSAAGYGVPINIDRGITAKMLNFKKIQSNPIYVQNSRGKFESSILHVLSQIMFDLNKISSDILLFSMSEFGFFKLKPEICTGSSIMPHKKNPDVLEIVRAKYYTVLAYEFEVKNIIGNLISGYNRDYQLTKKPIMESFEIVKNCLQIMIIAIESIEVNSKNCKKGLTKELYNTEEVYKNVKKGIPFRDTYKTISKECQ